MERKKRKPEKDKEKTKKDSIIDAGSLLGGAAIASVLLLSACQGSTKETETSSTTQITLPEDVIYSSDTQREVRIPPGQHEVENWPVLQYGGVVQIDNSDWTFTISGLVENNIELSYSEFMDLVRVNVFSDVHCVTGWSRLNNLWEGPSSRMLADMAGVKPEAKHVIVEADYGVFTANLMLEDFLQEDVLFAIRHDNQPLTSQHGAPVRLVVPRLYFWKSAKWVTGIEFTAEDQPGFWETAGYNNHGDPWKEERY